MTAPIRIALVGAGVMGSNHARVIAESSLAELAVVIDSDFERARALATQYGVAAASGVEVASSTDAAVVAASTDQHFLLAGQLIELGVPLLVEKPMTTCATQVRSLVESAAAHRLPLMCGFVERFNAVVGTVVAALDSRPIHILATRHSPLALQARSSVIWDLLIHDIDLTLRFAGADELCTVVAQSASVPSSLMTEIADCSLRFGSGLVATLSASRAGQRKVRNWQIATDTALYEVDLLRQTVTVYRHIRAELAFAVGKGYKAETIVEIPFVRHAGEPLAAQLNHFVGVLNGGDMEAELRGILPPHAVAERVAAA